MAEYEVGRRAPFVTVPLELLSDSEADPSTIAVYAVLRAHADFKSGKNAYPSDHRIAEWAGCSERTVRSRRKKLQDMGWVEWAARKGQTNIYTVHDSGPGTPAGGAEVPAGGAGPSNAGRQEVPEPRQEVPGGSARGAGVPRQEVPTTKSPNQEPSTTSSDEEGRTAAAAADELREFFNDHHEALATLEELPGFTDRERRTFLSRAVQGPDAERILAGIPPGEVPHVVAEAVMQFAEPRDDTTPVRWKAVSFRRYLQVAAEEHRAGIQGQRSAASHQKPLSREEHKLYVELRADYEDKEGLEAEEAAERAYAEAISGRTP